MLNLNDYIKESILNNDEQVQSNVGQAAEHAFDPIPKHTAGKDYNTYIYYFKDGDLKTWLKHATLDQWIILFDDAIRFLRRARSEYDDTRHVRLECKDCSLNFRLYKRTRAQGKGAINVNVCLTKDPIGYSWKIQDEFVKQRDKFDNNWNYWSYIAPGLDRKKAIQQIKTAIQHYRKDLFIQ